jgi:hypothetical protein
MKRVIMVSILMMFPYFLTMSSNEKCDLLVNGKYKVHFQTKGFEDYELAILEEEYIKTLKDGSLIKGKLDWRAGCILILAEPETSKEPLLQKIDAGLGQQCMLLVKKKGKATYFRTTRTANLNIVINEGRFIKLTK